MHLIVGGAYQGKLDTAKNKFEITDDQVFTCTDETVAPDFSKKCIYHVEKFALYCTRNGIEAAQYFKDHRDEWVDSVIICEDIFCGVVPIDDELRAWREMTGRLSIYLSNESASVTRVFCGLEQKLK